MKKFAHRVLALIVALSVLLLPAAALAEERNAAALTIGNFSITMEDETITLPVYLTLSGGVDVENVRGALGAALSTSNATALSALASFENGEIRAMLNGMDYGLYATLESIIALVEEMTGMTMDEMIATVMEEAASELPAGFMNQMNGLPAELAEAAEAVEAVDMDPQRIYDALGLVVTDAGESKYAFFEAETPVSLTTFTMESKTLTECIDAVVALDPAYTEFWAQYEAYLNDLIASEGEGMTIDEVLDIVAIGLDGKIYTNEDETAVAVEVNSPLTAEGETVNVYSYFTGRELETGFLADVGLTMNVDDEAAYISLYLEQTSEDGVDAWMIKPAFGIFDAETMESETEIMLDINGSTTADMVGLYIGMDVIEYDDTVSFTVEYVGDRGVFGETDVYSGTLSLAASSPYDGEFALSLDTELELSTLPEGDLITLPEGSIDAMTLLDEDAEEILSQLAGDAQVVLMQGVGVLMQDPALAEMLSSLLG